MQNEAFEELKRVSWKLFDLVCASEKTGIFPTDEKEYNRYKTSLEWYFDEVPEENKAEAETVLNDGLTDLKYLFGKSVIRSGRRPPENREE